MPSDIKQIILTNMNVKWHSWTVKFHKVAWQQIRAVVHFWI